MRLLGSLLLAAVLFAPAGSARAQFTAYNDFGGTSVTNVTSITLGQSASLKDFGTGVNTAVTLSVVAGSPSPGVDNGGTNGAMPNSGTDAFNIFNAIVDFHGYLWYSTDFSSAQLNFTGMDPAKTYELVISGNRDNSAYTDRITQFVVSDVDAFTNSHSGGTTLVTVNQANDGVKFVTGYNTVNGHVCRWTGIQPGADGDMSVAVGPPPGSNGRWYINGLKLTEFSAVASTLTFQQGGGGYAGVSAVDTYIQGALPSTNRGSDAIIKWDGEDTGGEDYLLLRFDNIFGTNPGQIAPTDVITSATLTYVVADTGNTASVNEAATAWNASDTFSIFGGEAGVQADEYGAFLGTASGTPLGAQNLDVTASVLAWKSNPATNLGWIFRPTGGTDGVQVRSSEDGTISLRPKLTVVVNGGSPSQKTLTVKHQPYLQLGNAPLASTGAGIGLTDQIVIVWQTVETGSGSASTDYFELEYRHVGDAGWTPVAPLSTLDTGTQTRVNWSGTITGLNYNDNYEYRVFHKRNPGSPILVNTYTGTIRTRLPMGDATAFRFAAYGDSARLGDAPVQAAFESVAARLSLSGAEFVSLLGDNIYDTGTHDAYDARLDGSLVPNQSAYIRNHIEYYCDGNHDSGDLQSGLAGRQNYFVPVPALGITSPVAPAVGQPAEDNYSFDYGLVHFAVIDSTVWGGITGPGPDPTSATGQANVLAWLSADLDATSQPWKFVCTHHPPKSYINHSDTGQGMAAELIPLLVQKNVDLLLVGHSHNYQRSFPLTGYAGADVTYTMDPSGSYVKGGQVIQVVAGTGGRALEGTAPISATEWLAKAFSSNNGGQNGPLIIDVSATELRVKYTAAGSGAVLDEFVIIPPGPTISLSTSAINRTVFLGNSLSNDSFTVTNTGPGTLNYTIADNANSPDWLTVSPTSGASTGEADPIDVSYNLTGLPAGVYNATITVSSPDDVQGPKNIAVSVTIQSVKPDFDGDGDVDMIDFGHLQDCLTGVGAAPSDPACFNAKLDGDSDIDSADVVKFKACLSGEGVPAAQGCDN